MVIRLFIATLLSALLAPASAADRCSGKRLADTEGWSFPGAACYRLSPPHRVHDAATRCGGVAGSNGANRLCVQYVSRELGEGRNKYPKR